MQPALKDLFGFASPRNSAIPRSVFSYSSRVLTWISSAKDEVSISRTFSISVSVGNSHLNFVAALEDHSERGGVF